MHTHRRRRKLEPSDARQWQNVPILESRKCEQLGQVALRRATAVQTKAEAEATVQSASSEPGSTESSSLVGSAHCMLC